MRLRARLSLTLALACAGAPALADDPFTLAGGRFRLGGEATFAFAAEDHGYFNYTDYKHGALRMARLALAAELRLGDRLAMLGEVRSDNFDPPRSHALYARIRPWTSRALDVQVGRIPPVFGAFPRRRYGPDNPLIGYPLAYQYLTSLRPDAVPATADDLLRMRGEGWLVRYPVGAPAPAAGLPLVSGQRWDTGAQVRLGSEPLQLSAALTQGTLANPRFRDDNDGKQVSARLAWQPAAGVALGASGARGAYLDRDLFAALPLAESRRDFRQRALGLDAEFSRDYWLLRVEAVWSEWDVPSVSAPLLPPSLRAAAVMVEARYKLAPGLWAATRVDHLGFERIEGSAGTSSWDAPVTRVEAGLGYSWRRNLSFKAAYQRNRRDGGEVHDQNFGAVQLLVWF